MNRKGDNAVIHSVLSAWAENGMYRVECHGCGMTCSKTAATLDSAFGNLPCRTMNDIDRAFREIGTRDSAGGWSVYALSAEMSARADEADRKALDKMLREMDRREYRQMVDKRVTERLRKMAMTKTESGSR